MVLIPAIAPLVLGAIISGIAGLIGATTSAVVSKRNSDTQRASVQDTNEANKELATQQNTWNKEQWNAENEYNAPSAQVQRLIAAGINPIFGGVDNMPASHLESVDLANQSPLNMPLNNWAQDGMAGFYQSAQSADVISKLGKNYEETRGAKAQADILSSDAKFRDAWNEGNLNLQNVDIQLKGDTAKLTRQQIKTEQKQLEVLDKNIAQMESAIALNSKHIDYQDIVNKFTPQRMIKELMKIDSDISYQEAQKICTLQNCKVLEQMVLCYAKDLTMKDQQLKIGDVEYQLRLQDYTHGQQQTVYNKLLNKQMKFQVSTQYSDKTFQYLGSLIQAGSQIMSGIGMFSAGRGLSKGTWTPSFTTSSTHYNPIIP